MFFHAPLPAHGIRHSLIPHILFFFALFFLPQYCPGWCLCAGGAGGGSAAFIERFGYGWLVPDERIDAFYNPAYLNAVTGPRLYLWSNGLYEKSSTYSSQTEDQSLSSSAFAIIPMEGMKLGLKYGISTVNISNNYDSGGVASLKKSLSCDFETQVFGSFLLGDLLNAGLYLGLNTHDFFETSEYAGHGAAEARSSILGQNILFKGGAVYDASDNFNIGVSFGGSFGMSDYSSFDAVVRTDDALKFNLFMLPELKPSAALLVRGYLGGSYESVLSYFYKNKEQYFSDETYYYADIKAGLGLYHLEPDGSSLIACLKAKYVPEETYRELLPDYLNTKTYKGFYAGAMVSVKKSFFDGRAFFAFGYELLQLSAYGSHISRESGGYLLSQEQDDIFEAVFFPDFTGNVSLSAGINPVKDIHIILNAGRQLFYYSSDSPYGGKNPVKTGIDLEVNFIFN